MKIFWKYIKQLYDLARWKLIINLILMVMLGMLEGVGILMLLPLLHFSGILKTTPTITVNDYEVGNFFQTIDPAISLPAVLIIYTGIILIQSGLKRYQSNINVQTQQSFHSFLSIRLFQSLANAKWPFLAGRKKSDITHILISELARITGGTQFFLQLTATAILSVIQIAIAFFLSPIFTMVVIIGGLVFFFLMQIYIRQVNLMGVELSHHNRDLFFAISEHLNGIKEVKSCGMEEMHVADYTKLRRKIEENYIRFNQVQSGTQMLYKVGAAVFISIFFYGAVSIFFIRPEELLLIIVIFARLWPRLSSFQGGLQHVVMMLPAFRAVLDFESECKKEKEAYREEKTNSLEELKESLDLKLGIELKDVSFSYHSKNSINAVKNLSFLIPAGTTLALVGESGAGKSTVADLITGLLTPTHGEVLVDGISLNKLNVHLWRKSIGYVPQDAFLFNASIKNNMLWANPEASEEEIWAALKMASVDDFAVNLAKGLETEVGDRGVRLSGGERQRIVLARALVRKPSVLILDEATSSLDRENEKRIHQAIEGLHGKMTILIIAHRLSTIKNADQIIVLDQGMLVEKGNYESLIKDQGSRFKFLASV
ncbi:MAG: ABC transporter ATP-binding protein [Dehalobacterium sp.]